MLARAPLSWVRETHVRAIAAHDGVEWLLEGLCKCKYTCHARHVFADLQRPPFFGTAEVTSHQRARELGAPAARAQPARNARGSSPILTPTAAVDATRAAECARTPTRVTTAAAWAARRQRGGRAEGGGGGGGGERPGCGVRHVTVRWRAGADGARACRRRRRCACGCGWCGAAARAPE